MSISESLNYVVVLGRRYCYVDDDISFKESSWVYIYIYIINSDFLTLLCMHFSVLCMSFLTVANFLPLV